MSKNSKNEITRMLKNFETAYEKKDLDQVQRFVEDTFIENSPVYYGTSGLEQFVGREQIAHLIQLDWKYWGILRFNYDQLNIHASETYGDFITTASLVWTVPSDLRLKTIAEDIQSLSSGELTCEQITKLALKLVQGLGEVAEGETHYYSLRVSGAVQKTDGTWKISSMHMSEANI